MSRISTVTITSQRSHTMENKNKIKLAILAVSSLLMISMTASAILADISAHYPHVDQSIIQMVLTLPALMGMTFALLSGPITTKISKKNLVIFGLISAFAGGSMALLFGTISIYVLHASSLLIGVAQGINSTMSMALIADYFSGNERSTLMGLQSAFVNGGSMVILLVSGFLAGIQWNYSYLIYLILVPVMAIVIKNLPGDSPVHDEHPSKPRDGKLNSVVFFTSIAMFAFASLMFVFQTNISIFIRDNGLGDASTAGMVNSVMTGTGALTGIFYGRIRGFLKSMIMPVAVCATGLGMLLVYAIGSLPSVFMAGIMVGFGLSSTIPTAMFNVSSAVSPVKSATAIALTNGFMNIGMFASPLIINPLAVRLNPGIDGFRFLLSAVGLMVLSVVIYAGNKYTNRLLALSESSEQ
ncbi:MFS transporter [Alkalibacter saccharofermentans]|nr:MFS transporter [Alkalibacter saccharofermentans]